MLAYAKAYTKEVLRRNKGKITAMFLSGTLAAELKGKVKGYTGRRSDVDVEIIGRLEMKSSY